MGVVGLWPVSTRFTRSARELTVTVIADICELRPVDSSRSMDLMSAESQARPAGGGETLSLCSGCTSLVAARKASSPSLCSCAVILERDSAQIGVISCCELEKRPKYRKCEESLY